MIRLIVKQTKWGVFGAIFAFVIGFFVKIYLIDIVGLESWGKYVIAQTFASFSETILSLGIPFIIIKFFPSFIEENQAKASRIATIFLKYALIVGIGYAVLIYFLSNYINHFVYSDINGLSWLLCVVCVHVPISMLFGVIISLYRSKLKIKEIVVYGTVVNVIVRAILTFIIFQFTNDILYFIILEIFTQILVLFIMLYLFNKNEFKIILKSNYKEVINDTKMIDYGKKMFYNSVVSFIASQGLSIIIAIKLTSSDVGAYNILLTLTGLTTFLLLNLNKVFAPAISKLHSEKSFIELNILYKKTTFLFNLFAIPLAVIIAIFSDEILGLYTFEMLVYKKYLFYMLVGGILNLAAGSSGTFMLMAGLEKQNLKIQLIRALLLIVLSLLFIPIIGLLSVVGLYVISNLFVNGAQVIYIAKYLKISPFSKELFFIFGLTILAMYFAINQEFVFQIFHFITVPILVYVCYFGLLFKPFKNLVKEIL
jgi:O-antigen/teichoic acid export membrane protein